MDERQANRMRLEEFIEREGDALHKTLRYYVRRAGLADQSSSQAVADELLNEVLVEAYRTVGRLKSHIHPRPWLLGIAANLIKREQKSRAIRERREPLLRDLYPAKQDVMSDEELFDQLPLPVYSSLNELESDEHIQSLLSGLSGSEKEVIRLAVLYDMNGETLAQTLGVTVSTARVRLHRALNHLRIIRQEDSAHE